MLGLTFARQYRQPFDLSDLEDCTVMLLDQIDQVQVDNLTNCRVFIGTEAWT